MAQALDEPVVVCVTSGSALLNVLPAVAEAHYQHHSLIVVSADRPAAWIDQLDGQTLRQPGTLEPWVAVSVNLPEVGKDRVGDASSVSPQLRDEQRWHCNRLVNEALIEATGEQRHCVHINIPISEPLFSFTTPQLPEERVIRRYAPLPDYDCLCSDLVEGLLRAERPMIVFGQMARGRFTPGTADYLFSHVIVLHESLADFPSLCHADEVLARGESSDLLPDFVIYVGDAIVSKRVKQFLRKAEDALVWRISLTGQVEDTFQNLRGIMVGDAEFVLQSLSNKLSKAYGTFPKASATAYRRKWLGLLRQAAQTAETFSPPYSQMAAVKCFEQSVRGVPDCCVHYANSSAIRLANIFAAHHVCCNRGVNGIEGSLSTAVGHAVALSTTIGAVTVPARTPDVFSSPVHLPLVFCVIGDLSFFYDQNALWNQNLTPNLRILLLNNGKGGIFDGLPGLGASAARDTIVSGSHNTTAEGICHQNGIDYLCANDATMLEQGMAWLTSCPTDRVRLLEVFTEAENDRTALNDYFSRSTSEM